SVEGGAELGEWGWWGGERAVDEDVDVAVGSLLWCLDWGADMRIVFREDGVAVVADGEVDFGGHARGEQGVADGGEDVTAHVGVRSLKWALGRLDVLFALPALFVFMEDQLGFPGVPQHLTGASQNFTGPPSLGLKAVQGNIVAYHSRSDPSEPAK
ncbi:hypothetical protein V492_03439, partial [Pseudogymnoascus sp. VKM F-4246]